MKIFDFVLYSDIKFDFYIDVFEMSGVGKRSSCQRTNTPSSDDTTCVHRKKTMERINNTKHALVMPMSCNVFANNIDIEETQTTP